MLYSEFLTGRNYVEFTKLLGSQYREFLRFSETINEIVGNIVEVYVKGFFLEGKYNDSISIYAFTNDKIIEIISNKEKGCSMTLYKYSNIETITFQDEEEYTSLSIIFNDEKYIRFSNDSEIYDWKNIYKDLIIAITKFLYSKF